MKIALTTTNRETNAILATSEELTNDIMDALELEDTDDEITETYDDLRAKANSGETWKFAGPGAVVSISGTEVSMDVPEEVVLKILKIYNKASKYIKPVVKAGKAIYNLCSSFVGIAKLFVEQVMGEAEDLAEDLKSNIRYTTIDGKLGKFVVVEYNHGYENDIPQLVFANADDDEDAINEFIKASKYNMSKITAKATILYQGTDIGEAMDACTATNNEDDAE